MKRFLQWLFSMFDEHLWDGSGWGSADGIVRPKINEEDWIEPDDPKHDDPDYFKVNQ